MTTIAPDPTIDRAGSPNLIGPKLPVPLLGQKPTEDKPAWFVALIVLAQFALFVGLLGPVMLTMSLKVATFSSDLGEQSRMLGIIFPPGALAAVFANAFFGRLSDRTTSRWGRRRFWIIGGTAFMVAALLIISYAPNVLMCSVGWFLAQLGANAAFSPYVASLADQLSDSQYGKVSGMVGMGQNVGIYAATWLGAQLSDNMLMTFLVPGLVALVGMTVYALALPEPVLKRNAYPFDLKTFLETFWTNPLKYPDFGMVWWSRFCIILASYLFTTFRMQYLQGHLGQSKAQAAGFIANGVLVYTIGCVVASIAAGWLSDRTGKRKFLVILSAVLFAVGTYLLVHAQSVTHFYGCELLLGIAYGIYVSVDLALVFEVLPNREDSGKDLGVFNMANALPQSLAPYMGGLLLTSGAVGTNFHLELGVAAVIALLGAAIIIPIRGAR